MKSRKIPKREVLIEKYRIVENTQERPRGIVVNRAVPIEHEPKRRNRFVVEFPEELELESWIVQKIQAPKFNMFKNKWDIIHIEFIDLIGPSSSQKLYEILQWSKEQKRNYAGTDKSFELFKFSLCLLDPVGVEIDKWIISVKNVGFDFGTFDYSLDGLAMTKMIIEPKDCVYKCGS